MEKKVFPETDPHIRLISEHGNKCIFFNRAWSTYIYYKKKYIKLTSENRQSNAALESTKLAMK